MNIAWLIFLTKSTQEKVAYCMRHHVSLDVASSLSNEMQLLHRCAVLKDSCWEHRVKPGIYYPSSLLYIAFVTNFFYYNYYCFF